jgi:hypothetical protein
MEFDVAGNQVSFDTDDPKTLPPGADEVFKTMIQDGITMTLDPLGNASDMKYPESWLKLMKEGDGKILPNIDFTKSPAGGFTNLGGLVFPAQAIARGHSWKPEPLEMDLPPVGKFKGQNHVTYQGPVRRGGRQLEQFNIKQKLEFITDPKAEVKVALKVEEAPGTVYFDNAAGRLIESVFDVNLVMDLEIMGERGNIKARIQGTQKLLDQAK